MQRTQEAKCGFYKTHNEVLQRNLTMRQMKETLKKENDFLRSLQHENQKRKNVFIDRKTQNEMIKVKLEHDIEKEKMKLHELQTQTSEEKRSLNTVKQIISDMEDEEAQLTAAKVTKNRRNTLLCKRNSPLKLPTMYLRKFSTVS